MHGTLKTWLMDLLTLNDDEEEETEDTLPDEPELWITNVRRPEWWPAEWVESDKA